MHSEITHEYMYIHFYSYKNTNYFGTRAADGTVALCSRYADAFWRMYCYNPNCSFSKLHTVLK